MRIPSANPAWLVSGHSCRCRSKPHERPRCFLLSSSRERLTGERQMPGHARRRKASGGGQGADEVGQLTERSMRTNSSTFRSLEAQVATEYGGEPIVLAGPSSDRQLSVCTRAHENVAAATGRSDCTTDRSAGSRGSDRDYGPPGSDRVYDAPISVLSQEPDSSEEASKQQQQQQQPTPSSNVAVPMAAGVPTPTLPPPTSAAALPAAAGSTSAGAMGYAAEAKLRDAASEPRRGAGKGVASPMRRQLPTLSGAPVGDEIRRAFEPLERRALPRVERQ